MTGEDIVREACENSMTYSEWQGRNYREEMRARCISFALQGGLSNMSSMSGSPSADTVLAKAKAFEAYIFGEQP